MADQELTAGNFCWVDFATPNPDGAKAFYQRVFNWKFSDNSMPDDGVYTMISTVDGDGVGGLFQMPEEMKKAGVPPHISIYVEVGSVDDCVKKAKDLGATVRMEPFDVFDYGRMAVLVDPTGATFSLWQSKSNDCNRTMASREAHGVLLARTDDYKC